MSSEIKALVKKHKKMKKKKTREEKRGDVSKMMGNAPIYSTDGFSSC